MSGGSPPQGEERGWVRLCSRWQQRLFSGKRTLMPAHHTNAGRIIQGRPSPPQASSVKSRPKSFRCFSLCFKTVSLAPQYKLWRQVYWGARAVRGDDPVSPSFPLFTPKKHHCTASLLPLKATGRPWGSGFHSRIGHNRNISIKANKLLVTRDMHVRITIKYHFISTGTALEEKKK